MVNSRRHIPFPEVPQDPGGLMDMGARGGPVNIAFKTAGRIVARRPVSVPRSCTFKSSVTVRSRRSLGPRGRLRATARFKGNELLGPVQQSIVLRVT